MAEVHLITRHNSVNVQPNQQLENLSLSERSANFFQFTHSMLASHAVVFKGLELPPPHKRRVLSGAQITHFCFKNPQNSLNQKMRNRGTL